MPQYRFNNNIKKLTESIKASEDVYLETVGSINQVYDEMRGDIKNILISLSHN